MNGSTAGPAVQAPRPVEVALLASVFVLAACGLVYELAAGALASYLLGDSVLQFSTIIGSYLFAMGIGSWLSRFFERQLPAHFLCIELMVALVGGLMPALLFLANAYVPSSFRFLLYALVLAVGTLVGLEIPLLMRILRRNVALKELVSQVLTFDYLGALAVSVAFPLLLVPQLGLIRTGLLFGLMNAAVALWALWLFRGELRRLHAHTVACGLTLATLAVAFAGAGRITTLAEDNFYQDSIVFSATSPWQRIVVTHGRAGHRLFLNGNLQFAERDEYRYHEALVHPAIAAQGAARRVAVLGVDSVTLVELDPNMTQLFSRTAGGAEVPHARRPAGAVRLPARHGPGAGRSQPALQPGAGDDVRARMGQGGAVTLRPGSGPVSVTRRALLAAAAWPLAGCEGAPELAGGFSGTSHERGHRLRGPAPAAATGPTRRTRVLIAGGGIAGLAAARALRQRGSDDFVLLELEDGAGGNSRGGSVGGIACPLGAHYLPVPGDDAPLVQDLLEELGLRRRVAGRWQYDERHLCHSPQERLFFQGRWQEGLLPLQEVGAQTLAQYRRFSQCVDAARAGSRYTVPLADGPAPAPQLALDAIAFSAWLEREQLTDPQLRWYLDYCCRDDYGAGLASVSAWAGIHYFASRHGFHLPGDGPEGDAVLTWPQGNGWLAERLAEPLGGRLRAGRVVTRIAALRHGVEVEAFNAASGAAERWQADHCIVALPVFVAARVVDSPPPLLRQAATRVRHAPWVVANLHLREPLADRDGPAPAWDNVIYGGQGLGYVDARHQSLDPTPGPTVLTWYRPLGDARAGRQQLLDRPWTAWRDEMLAELGAPHPDLARKASRLEVTRYGHAMAVPVPGTLRAWAGRAALRSGRLSFAYGDGAGYSVFEEAFTLGHVAGMAVV